MLSAAADGDRPRFQTPRGRRGRWGNDRIAMYISIEPKSFAPIGPDRVATPFSPRIAEDGPRALHARLLANAAARRLRAVERKQAQREDDADYWLRAAPVAVERAAELRCGGLFPSLP